jgi:2-dehydro-3-deoxyphosphooctonate aldolase (KDO 8-P synthase)
MTSVTPVQLADLTFGGGSPFVLVAGPCVIESDAHALELAARLRDVTARLSTPFVFKASYDKANRTSGRSFRGPGLDEGLRVLAAIKERIGVPILTDIHEVSHAGPAADVADILQIPAFLCRQTDLLVAAAKTGRIVNIKKGQFLAPDDVRHAVAKVKDAGNPRVVVTERGTSFGYHNLVVDMRVFPMIRETGTPVIFDVTHSLQLPGGGDGVTAGLAQYIEPLASAGVAAGVDGVFMEVHDDPSRARSDAQNALRLDLLEPLLTRLMALDAIVKRTDAVRQQHAGAPGVARG